MGKVLLPLKSEDLVYLLLMPALGHLVAGSRLIVYHLGTFLFSFTNITIVMRIKWDNLGSFVVRKWSKQRHLAWYGLNPIGKTYRGASLMVQWLEIRLPKQGTRVWALVWEDPTCRGATKPMRYNYWACALEPASHNYWALTPRARALQQGKPLPAHHNKE